MKGVLHTYEVRCSSCGKPKWPTLPFRPAAYVCALCTAVGPEKRGQRVAQAKKSRPRVTQDPTGGKESQA